MDGEEQEAAAPIGGLLLRERLRKLRSRVDGLLESKTAREKRKGAGEVGNAGAREEDEAAEAQAQAEDRAGTEAHDSAKGAAGSDDSSSEASLDSDDERMAEIVARSLSMHQAETSPVKEQKTSLAPYSLEVKWSPDIGIPCDKKPVPKPSSQQEKLLDGLLVPPREPRKLNKLVRKQKPDTAGAKWFNMPARTLTPELKRDLQLLKMRDVLDPKHHYKRDRSSKTLPKYFQVGTVVQGPGEFYSSRLTRKQRKTSIAEELLADANVNAYRKRKFEQIMETKKKVRSKNKKIGAK